MREFESPEGDTEFSETSEGESVWWGDGSDEPGGEGETQGEDGADAPDDTSSGDPATPGDTPSDSGESVPAGSPSRERVIEIARTMMEDPQIVAKSQGADGYRQGWEKLLTIFELAAPTWPNTPGWVDAGLKGSTDVGTSGIPHWCGIFALWAIKTAGHEVGEWKMGSGIDAVSGFSRTDAASIKVGDVGFVASPYQHHFLVASVRDDGAIDTVDGNSGGVSTVIFNEGRDLSTIDGFFTY